MYEILLLAFCLGSTPLNAPIQEGSVIQLSPNISFTGEDYDYKAIWVHDAPFVLVGQYYNSKLKGGFVMYTPSAIKPGQDIYVKAETRFVHIGVVLYRKRMVHVLAPINIKNVDQAIAIRKQILPHMKDYYGSF
jgi:hypothetical protein